MEIYTSAITAAWYLLTGGDTQVWPVVLLSLKVSGSAVAIATIAGVPLGYMLGTTRWGGRIVLILLVNTAMGFPPVVVGLFVWLALSRSGPLAGLNWLFTPQGMVVAQVILAVPLVIGVTAASVSAVPEELRLQMRALGASRFQIARTVLWELKSAVFASIIAGFGAIISEVGAVSIVGGGIENKTDVMTTAIMGYVQRGNIPVAMAWALVLIGIALCVNIALTTVQNMGVRYAE